MGISPETRTVRWREMDSNSWYRGTNSLGFPKHPGIAGGLAPARVMLAAACAAGVFNASQLIARVRDAVSSTPCGATLPAVAEIVEIVDDGLARLPVITSGF